MNRAIERAIQRSRVFGLETGRVNEHKLGIVNRANAVDAMPCGLGLARGNAHLLPHQRIEQGRLAHVGSSD
jgi:hypothetical protein